MTDNAFAYRHSRAFAAVLDGLGARHIRTPPYTPRWNGKVERFIQTLDDEWAHGHLWPNSTRRDRGLASWLRFYERRRPTPHSTTGHPSAAFTKTEGTTASRSGRSSARP